MNAETTIWNALRGVLVTRALGDHAPLRRALAPHGRHLDYVAVYSDLDLERRVVQVAPATVLQERRDRLERAAVESDTVASGAQREPVQLHGSIRRSGRAGGRGQFVGGHRAHRTSVAACQTWDIGTRHEPTSWFSRTGSGALESGRADFSRVGG